MSESPEGFSIVLYVDSAHRAEVVRLWNDVFGYETSHNEPGLVIDRKLDVDDGLLFVALHDGHVVGTVMAGYDGHRGWIYSLAVDPKLRHQGCGSALLKTAEDALVARGCLKINLQVVQDNAEVQGFYESNGYAVEARISMGKRMY